MNEHEKCHVELQHKPLDEAALSGAMAACLAIWGMGCPNCAKRIHNALLALEGVLQVNVVLEQAIATVAYDPQTVSVSDLLRSVAASGRESQHNYRAGIMTVMPAGKALAK